MRVWLDEAEIRLGDSLIEKIRYGIDSVDYVIALISDKSVSSKWVSRELDIAMNQEIEGRRVKVVPVLASKCDVPGFLKGKLHADMSTPKAYRQSVPALLNRLGVRDAFARGGAAKRSRKITEAPWIPKFTSDVYSEDPAKIYSTLKEAPAWRADELIDDSRALDRLVGLTGKNYSTHIRLRALDFVAGLEDPIFAYVVEPLLDDEDRHVRVAAIECLRRLQARDAAPSVLNLLVSSSDPDMTAACLNFFATVSVHDDATALSLVDACTRMMNASPQDRGLELRVTGAAVRQMSGGVKAVEALVISALGSSNDQVRKKVLEGIIDLSGDLWLRSRRSSKQLGDGILECTESEDPLVVAHSWLAILLLADSLPGFEDRDDLWKRIKHAERWSVEEWLELLDMYDLAVMFEQPDDVAGLSDLFGRFGERVDAKILDILAEVGTSEALDFLAASAYRPEGWKKAHVLKAIVSMPGWQSDLEPLLKAASENLPDFTQEETQALSLLAQHKAGYLSLDDFLAQFPRDFSGSYLDAEADRQLIASNLKSLKDRAEAARKRRLATICRGVLDVDA